MAKKFYKIYTVNIGNIGNLEYRNKIYAEKAFNEYVRQSKTNYGRASGESVYLMEGENTLKEYIGTIDQEQDQ